MNKKSIWAIIIVIVLIIVGGIWYYNANMASSGVAVTPPCCKTTASTVTTTTTTSTTTETSTPTGGPSITYVNSQYGFTFMLPADWQGYTIVTSTWTGYNVTPVEHGPIISIRNPAWTAAVPTQDIPIMVFTIPQWVSIATGTMAVSAAPIPPSEIGASEQYVFAIPPRYNYAYPADWQEVQTILSSDPLSTSSD